MSRCIVRPVANGRPPVRHNGSHNSAECIFGINTERVLSGTRGFLFIVLSILCGSPRHAGVCLCPNPAIRFRTGHKRHRKRASPVHGCRIAIIGPRRRQLHDRNDERVYFRFSLTTVHRSGSIAIVLLNLARRPGTRRADGWRSTDGGRHWWITGDWIRDICFMLCSIQRLDRSIST